MSLWKNYFGLGPVASSGATPTDKETPARSLPVSWYTSQELYELERRAIFSRKWLLTTHVLRLPNTGDWIQYKIAGYPFVLVKDRQGNINAFHNVCRHRAFPVVTEESGTSRIFACQYHGWSYGLNGKLAKAPGYQDIDGFDKSKNGLLPIHVHVDKNGFIWVNMDAGEKPETAWEDDFKDVDLQPRFKDFDFADYEFDHTWEMEGEYNWKILADNYSERYQCQTSQLDVPSLADSSAKPEQIEQGLKIASTYYFPNASMTASPHFFFMQRFVPTSPTSCAMKYEVYRNKSSSTEDFGVINQVYKRIMSEDKDLCINTQKDLNNGELRPEMEKEPSYFQTAVQGIVTEHREKEEKDGKEIWPARQRLPETAAAGVSKEDEEFCRELDFTGKRQQRDVAVEGCGMEGCCSAGKGAPASGSLVY
ncbi:aromatic ring-hydroxylating oxygenase subunit alpha [Aspergillus chevalieri]|uniref:Choline monooxygenase, chloroplastic n=1 Tax=Aspergillus chevalieri TaxID=182096 RepID=A0A7R7VI09_ASPCH|nr:uncharacterized protein ACHE_20200S [Aspergillus chevalieri]BCR84742.1 hypothetical protein ACHE_20200S [Aspergillus chevalieri]